MNVKMLAEFIGSGDQKVFHILTVTHLYGGIAGTVAGTWLLQPFFGVWGLIMGAVLGLLSTWKRNGRPLYGWAIAYVRFLTRELFKVGDASIDASIFYAKQTSQSEPYMVMRADGSVVMVNRGSESGGDLWDRIMVIPQAPDTPNSDALAQGRNRPAGRPTSSSGQAAQSARASHNEDWGLG